MFKRYDDVCAKLASRLNVWQWWLMAIVLWVVSQQTMGWLNGLYAASQFPVSFFVGQTTFNAAELKSYYAVLLELGTLDKFIGVQLADYVYMATVLASLFVAMVAVYRILPNITWLKKIGWFMVLLSPAAAGFDALENLISFILLANPLTFSDWLVYPYSSLAVAKFGAYAVTYLWAILALLSCAIVWPYVLIKQKIGRVATV
ncbi:hypothetical protein QFX18_01175 [Saccharophagus degradans]|uniref:hypothetical protein n=1 Tax=Saccharophagus degradans TaxID=86304 RepID=UPI0024781EE4|nr:hypothetical protein [Saccharophagus degradans]WGO98672.1 hypothetical protein QFX18_01175 [Saccharophagus degradans]